MKRAEQAAPPLPGLQAPEVCLSCGERAMLDYCARCGERRPSERDLSLRSFGARALAVVTNLDTTIGRTFRGLLRRPGHPVLPLLWVYRLILFFATVAAI